MSPGELPRGQNSEFSVLEDDIRLIVGNVHACAKSMNAMPREWNLAYFWYAGMNLTTPLPVRLKLLSYYPVMYMFGSKKHDPRTIRRIFRRSLNRYWMHAGWFNGAVAYALDRSAARFIAEAQTSIAFEADLVLNHLVRFSGLKAICLKDPIFEPRMDIPSLIGSRPSWRAP